MSFISELGNLLISEKGLYNLSRNIEFSEFDFIGVKESTVALEFVAFVTADALTESRIVDLRDRFFEITKVVPREFGLKPRGRNPNGLLCFVFTHVCPEHIIQFIKKQTRISHSATKGAVIVSWAIDLEVKQIYTHNNPVSFFPPVMIIPAIVFPNKKYLENFMGRYITPTIEQEKSMTGFDPIAIAALTKGVDFLFDQAGKLMEERRSARKARNESDDTPRNTDINQSPTKEEVNSWKPKKVYLQDIPQEIESCLEQIQQYRINKRDLEREAGAYGGATFAPIIVRSQLRMTEDEIKRWCQKL